MLKSRPRCPQVEFVVRTYLRNTHLLGCREIVRTESLFSATCASAVLANNFETTAQPQLKCKQLRLLVNVRFRFCTAIYSVVITEPRQQNLFTHCNHNFHKELSAFTMFYLIINCTLILSYLEEVV